MFHEPYKQAIGMPDFSIFSFLLIPSLCIIVFFQFYNLFFREEELRREKEELEKREKTEKLAKFERRDNQRFFSSKEAIAANSIIVNRLLFPEIEFQDFFVIKGDYYPVWDEREYIHPKGDVQWMTDVMAETICLIHDEQSDDIEHTSSLIRENTEWLSEQTGIESADLYQAMRQIRERLTANYFFERNEIAKGLLSRELDFLVNSTIRKIKPDSDLIEQYNQESLPNLRDGVFVYITQKYFSTSWS
jgi:hypothetical protein